MLHRRTLGRNDKGASRRGEKTRSKTSRSNSFLLLLLLRLCKGSRSLNVIGPAGLGFWADITGGGIGSWPKRPDRSRQNMLMVTLTKRVNYSYTSIFLVNQSSLICLFVCVEVLRPSQQLRSCQAGQLPISTVPGQA